jgi:hypothetical protein
MCWFSLPVSFDIVSQGAARFATDDMSRCTSPARAFAPQLHAT